MTIDKIKQILADTLDVNEEELSADTNIATDLGADSLDVVEILMSIEDEFNVEIPDSEIENIRTIGELADYIGSTSGIMNYAVNSGQKEFIIGTEISIQEHLQYQCPDKRFYYLTQKLICPNMKSTTLIDLYNCVAGKGGEEILLDSDTIIKARKCIDEMIRLGEA